MITQFFFNAINNENNDLNYIVFDTQNNKRIRLFLVEFLLEYFNPSSNNHEIESQLLILIILDLTNSIEEYVSLSSMNKTNSIIISALKYMQSNFTDCTLQSTSEYIHINPCYLSRLLKKHLNLTYKELIIQLRMKHAFKLIRNTNFTIEQIAFDCGYHNLTFFYKKFYELYNKYPKDIRNKK